MYISFVFLAFETKELRRLCESQTYAEEQLGVNRARHLRVRLADIQAACRISELDGLGDSVVHTIPDEHLTIEFDGEIRFVFYANHNNNPLKTNCEINWDKVTRIKLMAIE